MKKKKSRLGVVSHVGVVLSFVIFVTFVIFIYMIVRPTVTTENKQNLLDYVEGVIIENSSANLVGASVLIGEFPQTCAQLVGFFDRVETGNRVIARNNKGEVLNARISGQDLYVEKNGEEIFLKIYGSEEFDITETGTMSGCRYLTEGPQGYVLGLVRTEKNVFEKRIIELIESYNNNYESLKGGLNMGSDDFRLGFTYANGTVVSTEEKEVLGNVFINEVPIQYISKNAAREAGSLNVGIW